MIQSSSLPQPLTLMVTPLILSPPVIAYRKSGYSASYSLVNKGCFESYLFQGSLCNKFLILLNPLPNDTAFFHYPSTSHLFSLPLLLPQLISWSFTISPTVETLNSFASLSLHFICQTKPQCWVKTAIHFFGSCTVTAKLY